MIDTLLATKLFVPSTRSNAIRRPRLVERLNAGLDAGHLLALISAPAGYGKTTLLAEWLAQHRDNVGWLALDDQDNHALRFWMYLIAALQPVTQNSLGQNARHALESSPDSDWQAILTSLVNDMATLERSVILVLDDYHVISNPTIHEGMTFLLDHLSPSLHLVIATRADPPLPISRLRARGQLIELRVADLRFTADEALAFLNDSMNLGLTAQDVQILETRTEGWIVGLQLAALSMQGRADTHAFIQAFTGSHHYVLEYLADEVLQRQPEPLQRFLIETSILNRLCAPLCDAVTERTDSVDVLATLYRSNLFLVPLDNERVWYRYHHLFADLIRARLEQSNPGLIPTLHQRAADWFDEHALPTEAVHHAFAAQDYLHAADLMEQHAPSRWALSDTAFLTMIGKLPMELVQARPGLAIHHAFALVVLGQHQAAETVLRGMMPHIPAEPNPEMKAIASFATVLLVYIDELMGNEALVELPDPRSLQYVPEQRLAMRNTADATYAFLLHFRGEFDRAEELLLGAVQRDMAANGTTAIPIAISRLGRIRIVQGRLREAAALCREYLRRVEERGQQQFYIVGSLNLVLGDVLREWNDLENAEREIRHGILSNEPWPSPESRAIGHFLLARVLLAQGNLDGAEDAYNKVDQTISSHLISPDLSADIRGFRVRLWLAQGNLTAAQDLTGQWDSNAPLDFRHERDQITRARVLLAQGELADAHTLLDRLKGPAEQSGRTGRQIEIALLNALALNELNQRPSAFKELELCLALAAPQGYQRIFLDEGEPMQVLISDFKSQTANSLPRLREYAVKLLAAFPPSKIQKQDSVSQNLVEPLTPREFQVLQLVCAGDSNRAIAEKLFITISAVKKHTGNIFGKLGVSSRTQAIIRARELNLISPRR